MLLHEDVRHRRSANEDGLSLAVASQTCSVSSEGEARGLANMCGARSSAFRTTTGSANAGTSVVATIARQPCRSCDAPRSSGTSRPGH